jgi:hypothetical protein
MKKESVRKLVLSRESIIQLTTRKLQGAQGGISHGGSECTAGPTNCGPC